MALEEIGKMAEETLMKTNSWMLPTKLQKSLVPKPENNCDHLDSVKTTDIMEQFQGSKLNLNYLLLHLHVVNDLFPWATLTHTL